MRRYGKRAIIRKQTTKPLFWLGSSRKDLRGFPEPVKDIIGHALFIAQLGRKHEDAKPPAYQIRDAWLVDTEDLGRPRLCQPSLLDDDRDPGSDLGLDEQLITLSKPDVFEDIPAAPLDRDLGLGPSPIRPTCSRSHDLARPV